VAHFNGTNRQLSRWDKSVKNAGRRINLTNNQMFSGRSSNNIQGISNGTPEVTTGGKDRSGGYRADMLVSRRSHTVTMESLLRQKNSKYATAV